MSGTSNTSDKILIPYNEDTKYIYEGFAKVAREILERKYAAENAAKAEEKLIN